MKKIIVIILLFKLISCNRDGSTKEYYPSGAIKAEGQLINGKTEGKVLRYFENGNLELDANYINGIESGSFTKYYSNGNVDCEGYYLNGKLNGILKAYNKNGIIITSSIFKNGKEITYQYYDDDGDSIPDVKLDAKKSIITLGEEFQLAISIPSYSFIKSAEIQMGKVDSLGDLLQIQDVIQTKNNKGIYKVTPKIKAIYKITGIFHVVKNNGKEQNYSFKYEYMINPT